jgi:hypothetical protein
MRRDRTYLLQPAVADVYRMLSRARGATVAELAKSRDVEEPMPETALYYHDKFGFDHGRASRARRVAEKVNGG